MLTFTWDVRALNGHEKIASYLKDTLPYTTISNVRFDKDPHFAPTYRAGPPESIEFGFTYESTLAWGKGFVRLVRGNAGQWLALTASMIADDLKGHEEVSVDEDWEAQAKNGAWGDLHAAAKAQAETNPTVLIVGAGQNGLQVAARFRNMRIPTLLIDRTARIGDNWRQRYKSLALHTTKEHHQLLYQPFPSTWPCYTPRDKLADWFETYAINQNLVYWTKSTILGRPVYDKVRGVWDVTVQRDNDIVHLAPAHIVMATGVLGGPYIPEFANREVFPGSVLHTTQYSDPTPFSRKRVVVVGAGNTAIDVCQDLVGAGAQEVTMVQRSETCVVSRDNVEKRLRSVWVPGVDVAVGDMINMSTPLGFIKQQNIAHQAEQWEQEKVLHAKLRKGGVKLSLGPDGGGQIIQIWERLGGYWQDKGGADLIESGEIKIKQGVQPVSYSPNGLVFDDGSELAADVIMLSTGYINMQEINKKIFGAEVIEAVGRVHGLDEEGEIYGSYRPTKHPGLWFAGGDFYAARTLSKQLGILIIASKLGLINDTRSNL